MRTQITVEDAGAPYPVLPIPVLVQTHMNTNEDQRQDELITRLALLSLGQDMAKPEVWLTMAEQAEREHCPEAAQELFQRAMELEARV